MCFRNPNFWLSEQTANIYSQIQATGLEAKTNEQNKILLYKQICVGLSSFCSGQCFSYIFLFGCFVSWPSLIKGSNPIRISTWSHKITLGVGSVPQFFSYFLFIFLSFQAINFPAYGLTASLIFPLVCLMSFFKHCQVRSKQFRHSCDPTVLLVHSWHGELNQYCI